jgi:deoxyribodipyrimidine photo-lyase
MLPEFLAPFQDVLLGDPSDMHDISMVDWDAAYASLKINRDVKPVDWLIPGYSAGLEMIDSFINTRLKTYGDLRNDPNIDTASHLSPYAHFGQVYIDRTD